MASRSKMASRRHGDQALQKKRQKRLVICVCGMTGCGKSTLSNKLAQKYGLEYLSGGDALKALAVEMGYKPGGRDWWETKEGMRFLQQRVKEPEFDRRVDEKLIKLAEHGNVVLDSWTMPWLLEGGLKVWLEASPEVRAKRIAERGTISLELALKTLRERDKKTGDIYKRLYGFDLGEDFSPFNMILDTNELSADEVFRVLCMIIDHIYTKKN